jgi:hypothetical protein
MADLLLALARAIRSSTRRPLLPGRLRRPKVRQGMSPANPKGERARRCRRAEGEHSKFLETVREYAKAE